MKLKIVLYVAELQYFLRVRGNKRAYLLTNSNNRGRSGIKEMNTVIPCLTTISYYDVSDLTAHHYKKIDSIFISLNRLIVMHRDSVQYSLCDILPGTHEMAGSLLISGYKTGLFLDGTKLEQQ